MGQGDNGPASMIRPERQQSDIGSIRRPEEPMTPTGPGYIASRLGSPVPRDEKEPTRPNLEVQDVNGQRRTIDDGDYQSKRRLPALPSETGESEGASSIISVPDYGFAAAHKFLGPDENAIPDHIMNASELQVHLGLESIEGQSIAKVISAKLEQQLCPSMMNSNAAEKQPQYLPIDRLYSILDIDCISSLVKERYPTAIDKDFHRKVADITGGEGAPRAKGRWRILAIMLYSEYLDGLKSFIDNGIRDEDLPLERCSQRSTDCVTRTRRNDTNRSLFKGWSRTQLTLFFEYQHIFHVPFFDLGEDRLCSYEFPPKASLPWLSFEYVTSGGSGTVYRIQIHPSHHNYGTYSQDPQKPVYFALKRINSVENEAYKKEITAHEKACAKLQKGGHIIKLLLTLEHGEYHYLLFEWADGALDEFWENRTVKTTPEAEKWAARQCFGLASALKQIHGQATWQRANRSNGELSPAVDAVALDDAEYGRHGDIKPQNILWFSTYGTDGRQKDHMVLSDLGLTRYHTSLTRSRVTSSKIDGYSKAYRAPEMDLDNPIISRKFDVWSLGCVFLEFCIWYLEGMMGIARFAKEREDEDDTNVDRLKDSKFFRIKRRTEGAKVAEIKTTVTNPALMQWLDRLTHHYSSNVFAKHILDIIRTKMLVAEVKERKEIDIICRELLGIIEILGDDLNVKHSPLPSPTMPTDPNQEHNQLEPADFRQIVTAERDSAAYDKIYSGDADEDDNLLTTTVPATQASLLDGNIPTRLQDDFQHLQIEAITIGGSETEGQQLTQNVQAKVDIWMEHGGGEGPTAPHSRTTSHRVPSLRQEPVDTLHFPEDSASMQSRMPASLSADEPGSLLGSQAAPLSIHEPEPLPESPAAVADLGLAVQLQPQPEPNWTLVNDDVSLRQVTDTGPPVVLPAPIDATTTVFTAGGEDSLPTNVEDTEGWNEAVAAPAGRLKTVYHRFRGALKNAKAKIKLKVAPEKGSDARGRI